MLADGYIDGPGNIVCPVHGYRYELKNGRNSSGEGYYLKNWPVEIRKDGVYLGMEESSTYWSLFWIMLKAKKENAYFCCPNRKSQAKNSKYQSFGICDLAIGIYLFSCLALPIVIGMVRASDPDSSGRVAGRKWKFLVIHSCLAQLVRASDC